MRFVFISEGLRIRDAADGNANMRFIFDTEQSGTDTDSPCRIAPNWEPTTSAWCGHTFIANRGDI